MPTYISLLRGINVAGHNMIKMPALAHLYRALGFENVRTYLQSGNVIFDAPEADIQSLSNAIEEKIKQAFGFSVRVLIRTPADLRQIVRNNPFLREKDVDATKLHVTFLSGAPAKAALAQITEGQDRFDGFVISGKEEVYLYCPGGYGQTKFSNGFFERKLGLAATTRNWKTVNVLLELAEGTDG